MGTYCVPGLEPVSGRDKGANPTQSSLWKLMINGETDWLSIMELQGQAEMCMGGH